MGGTKNKFFVGDAYQGWVVLMGGTKNKRRAILRRRRLSGVSVG